MYKRQWYDNPQFTGVQTVQIKSGSYGDVMLYARWETISYSISFILNGGTVSGVLPAGYNIESDRIILPTPMRTAYNFNGWYENASLPEIP